MKYESIDRSTKAHAFELQQKLMRTQVLNSSRVFSVQKVCIFMIFVFFSNEELLDCNVMLELRASDCLKYQSQISSMEEQLQDLIRAKEKVGSKDSFLSTFCYEISS